MSAKKVFISYSHDSDQHSELVLRLATSLRRDGMDCRIDQFISEGPPEGWMTWMEDSIEWADFVLMVCTETYNRRVRKKEMEGTGLGVTWEAALINTYLYEAQGRNSKFLPVFFDESDKEHIPTVIRGGNRYLLDSQPGYDRLYKVIAGQTRHAPEVGEERIIQHDSVKPLFGPAGSRNDGSTTRFGLESLPQKRNRYFTGRVRALDRLRETLKEAGIAVLSGLGGIGKTQTVLEYVYRYSDDYRRILWVTLGELQTPQAVPSTTSSKSSREPTRFEELQEIISLAPPWLLVIDNADEQDDPRRISRLLPNGPSGEVIITSRRRLFDSLGVSEVIDIDRLGTEEAIEFFETRIGRRLEGEERFGAEALAERLDGLPLALEQAAAYVHRMSCSFTQYLEAFRRRGLELIANSLPVAGQYPESVMTTWSLNFEQVRQISPAAGEFLKVCSLLNADHIPLDLVRLCGVELGIEVAHGEEEAEAELIILEQLVEPLKAFSLIRYEAGGLVLSLHRLVQAVVQSRMSAQERLTWLKRVAASINLFHERLIPKHIEAYRPVMLPGRSGQQMRGYYTCWPWVADGELPATGRCFELIEPRYDDHSLADGWRPCEDTRPVVVRDGSCLLFPVNTGVNPKAQLGRNLSGYNASLGVVDQGEGLDPNPYGVGGERSVFFPDGSLSPERVPVSRVCLRNCSSRAVLVCVTYFNDECVSVLDFWVCLDSHEALEIDPLNYVIPGLTLNSRTRIFGPGEGLSAPIRLYDIGSGQFMVFFSLAPGHLETDRIELCESQ